MSPQSSPPTKAPLHLQVRNRVLQGIKAGRFPDGKLLPSERELCLHFSVSRQTVRNALAPLVAEGWLAPRFGKGTYVQSPPKPSPPHTSAPSPGARSLQVGLIYDVKLFLGDPATMEMILGIKGTLSQRGYALSLSVASRDSLHQVVPCYPDWVRHRTMDGYILWSAPPELQKRFQGLCVPTVSLGYLWGDANLPSVAIDFRWVFRQAVHRLHALGHRRIHFVNWKRESTWTRESAAGFLEGLRETGLRGGESLIESTEDTPYEMVSVFRRLVRMSRRPTAVLLGGASHLERVLPVLDSLGVKVPEDMVLFAAQANPSRCPFIDRLAYFEFDYVRFGKRSAQMLFEILQNREARPIHELYREGKVVLPSLGGGAAPRKV